MTEHRNASGCEWNPTEDRPANVGEKSHAAATWVVGSGASAWHVCASCAELPFFKRRTARKPLATEAPPITETPRPPARMSDERFELLVHQQAFGAVADEARRARQNEAALVEIGTIAADDLRFLLKEVEALRPGWYRATRTLERLKAALALAAPEGK